MLDFSKNGIDLIKDIVNQIKENLCESNSKLKDSLLIRKEKTSFPFFHIKIVKHTFIIIIGSSF